MFHMRRWASNHLDHMRCLAYSLLHNIDSGVHGRMQSGHGRSQFILLSQGFIIKCFIWMVDRMVSRFLPCTACSFQMCVEPAPRGYLLNGLVLVHSLAQSRRSLFISDVCRACTARLSVERIGTRSLSSPIQESPRDAHT